MTDANEVMDLFMKRLSNGEFEKENLSNDWPEINDDFIEKKLRSYSMLLKTVKFIVRPFCMKSSS